MVTAKGDETRAGVLEAGLALASEVGLEQVTIGKLAEKAGLSKSGLFAHFSSKENLQVALLDEAARRFVDTVVAPALRQPRGEPRLRALFERWLAWGKAPFLPGGCIFIAAAIELDDRPGPARDRLVAIERDWLETLAGAARIAVTEGHFREGADPEQIAHEVFALAHGHHVVSRLMGDPKAEPRTRAAFERIVRDAQKPRRS